MNASRYFYYESLASANVLDFVMVYKAAWYIKYKCPTLLSHLLDYTEECVFDE